MYWPLFSRWLLQISNLSNYRTIAKLLSIVCRVMAICFCMSCFDCDELDAPWQLDAGSDTVVPSMAWSAGIVLAQLRNDSA